MARITNESYDHENSHEINYVRYISSSNDGYDITNIFSNIQLLEDLDGGFMRGECVFIDLMNMMESLSPDGSEQLQIKFSSRDKDFQLSDPYIKTFYVQNWTYIPDPENLNRTVVKLILSSRYELEDEKVKISRSYKNITGSQFVNNALDILGYEEERNIEDTLHAKEFISPNLSPLQMIEFFTRNSQSKDSGSGDYYFFENRNGINFVTSTALVSQDPVDTLVMGERSQLNTYNMIKKYVRSKGMNITDQYRHGGFGMTTVTSSYMDKEFKYEQTSKSDVKNVSPYLNDKLYNEETEDTYSHVQYWPKDGMYKVLDLSQVGNMVPQRTIQKTMLHARILHVVIPGNTSITAGDVVNIEFPDQKGEYSELESGRHLVGRIVHNITPISYTQDLELYTDSFRRRG